MVEVANEVIDSQIVAEHVGFLDNCFDNSFSLQCSLVAVKEYVTEELMSVSAVKKNEVRSSKNTNASILSKNTTIDCTILKTNALTQIKNQNVLNRNLKAWGLPEEIVSKYQQRGITEMFEWQVTCLANLKVLLDCSNLVYSAPTSAGKTLVAEIITIKTILERQKKVIIILPFVSIVREKMIYLQDILSSSGIRVEGFMGSQSPPGGLQAVHVAICTIEKANSLVNRLLDDGSITDLGAVIVDELHLLGDPHRGYILELLLTKIKYISMKSDNVQIQIIGMSATLPNLEILANWLCAELFITQFRPIPLDEFCLVGKKLFDKTGKCVNTLKQTNPSQNESDNVLNICLDTIKDGCSILIFCMTKNRCENLAQTLASSFYSLGCQQCESGFVLRSQLNTESISEVLEQLKNCPVGLDQVLMKTISFGVAYHHAGLTFDERDIIEGAFKSGAIRVLVATSTLSSGVNLPARKVIIRSPVFLRQPINILTYKQMIGRAGRMGKDTKGESILICTDGEKKIGFDLMMGALDPVKSCIESEDKYMRAVLEMIASQVLCTKAELDLYSKCTLLSTQQGVSTSQNELMEKTLKELKNYELVRIQDDGEEVNYVATSLGKACLSASMAPNDGLSLFLELQKARQCLVLETDLHLIYLVTPYSVSSQWGDIDWLHLLSLWESLTKAMKRVGELVGVQESFIICCLRGTNKINNAQNKLNIHKRFYTALALQDLVNEVPLSEVAMKFRCPRGFLQSLQQSAATFAGMVTAFCHQLGWKNMEILVSQFQDRLHFGIHSELLELMKLSSLNGVRARALFDSGFDNVSSIASADEHVIENILLKAIPFQSEKEREGDDSDDVKKRNKIKSIWITGCCGMTAKEAAQNLIQEARKYLVNEIGVAEIKWNSKTSCDVSKEDKDIKKNENNTPSFVQDQDIENEKQEVFMTTNSVMISDSDTQETRSRKTSINFLENSSDDIFLNAYPSKADKHETIPIDLQENTDENITKPTITVETNEFRIPKDAILPLLKSTPISETTHETIVGRDDIVWDSLNFTDAAIENITKLRSSDKIFSPNISFGDTDKSNVSIKRVDENASKCTSVKDESLFSTDGDNSSFFEESLPLDAIPSKILDNKISPTIVRQRESTVDFMKIVDSNSILNAFKSPLVETDDDEDIKLVYDDDDSQSEVLNLSKENEVVCSQEKIKSIKDFISPYKRRYNNKENTEHKAKKKKLNESGAIKRNNFYIPKLHVTDSANTAIQINNYNFNCIMLKENEIYKNLRVLENMQAASIHLKIKDITCNTNEIIGSNILNIPKTDIDIGNIVLGIAIYLGQGTCVFLDLTSLKNKMTLENKMLKCWFEKDTVLLKMFSLKRCYFYMRKWLDISLPFSCVDVSLAEWLIDSDDRLPHIEFLMKKYCGLELTTASLKVDNKRKPFKNLDYNVDACIRAWCVWMVAEKQEVRLRKEYEVSQDIIDIESQVATILANCEYHGIAVDRKLASKMLLDVKKTQEILQKKANRLTGFNVNLNSSKAVAKVLGIYSRGRVSTKKSVLSCHNTPLSSIVIFWRKLNCILTKTLYSLTEKAHVYSEGNRINPTYTMHTCTGRISMHEPNLQNVPRTFTIPCSYLEDNFNGVRTTDEAMEFNCRNIFKASPGHVMVSADYCQLEMRILTHFSEDSVLMKIMRSGVDVFKSIAASWSDVPEEEVDDDLRQKAKQLCYGILYGMGNKTLAQHLDVAETEAAFFMESFYKTFPDVRRYTQGVIQVCREKGYVETLMRRRRHLPGIRSKILATRSASERQAVNTTIQGSAADIAKAAMCAIDNKKCLYTPKLLLQMHDELIYEVPESHKQNFFKTLKDCMEGTVKLKVPLPVKVKCGYSWGDLKEVKM